MVAKVKVVVLNKNGSIAWVEHKNNLSQALYYYDQYKDKDERRDDASREETAHKVAWAAVKNSYEKGDDDKWHKKK